MQISVEVYDLCFFFSLGVRNPFVFSLSSSSSLSLSLTFSLFVILFAYCSGYLSLTDLKTLQKHQPPFSIFKCIRTRLDWFYLFLGTIPTGTLGPLTLRWPTSETPAREPASLGLLHHSCRSLGPLSWVGLPGFWIAGLPFSWLLSLFWCSMFPNRFLGKILQV